MTDHYGLFGNPVSHSLSPWIQQRFAAAADDEIRYEAIEVPVAAFAATADRFFAEGGLGLNITLPFKFAAGDYCQHRDATVLPRCLLPEFTADPEPNAAGMLRCAELEAELLPASWAVNVLICERSDGAALRIMPAMTDGAGLVLDLNRWYGAAPVAAVSPDGIVGKLVLLGGGGAATAVLPALLFWLAPQFSGELLLISRDLARAQRSADWSRRLVAAAGGQCRVRAADYDGLQREADGSVALAINATDLGHRGQVPPLPPQLLAARARCYDMSYGAAAAPWRSFAEAQGIAGERFRDGLGMLLGQALYSFALWRGMAAAARAAAHFESLRTELQQQRP